MDGELEQKVAIVTGGAGGIGAATVELFVQSGARVVVADLQQERGQVLADRLGRSVEFRTTDVTDADSLMNTVNFAVERFGSLDIMFNNAGVAGAEGATGFLDNDLANYDRVMAVDLLGPMLGARAAARVMAKSAGGVIINTASIAGTYSGYGLPEYRAAKAGVIALTKSLALELGQYDIRVNCISPGPILTEIVGMGAEMTEDIKDAVMAASMGVMLDMQVLKRVGQPRDVAEAALFLAGDRAAQITGLDLVVDGGASLGDRVNRLERMSREIDAVLARTSHQSS